MPPSSPTTTTQERQLLRLTHPTGLLEASYIRWPEFLSQFNFVITYRPGTKATIPDALSRMPGSKPAGADDERLRHRHQVVLPQEKVDPAILEELIHDARQDDDLEFVAAMDA